MLQLYHTRDEIIHSSACGDYRLMLCWPDEPAPEQGWPVIYLLDGASHYPIAESLMRSLTGSRCRMRPGVVVAIDYPDGTRRERDYRPAVARRVEEPDPGGGYYPMGMEGRSEAFLAFIQQQLKPYISGLLPIDRSREALFGHSYGGLFALNTLFTCRSAFRHFYASSPSVWWNDGYINAAASAFIQQDDASPPSPPTVLFLSVGEYEQSLERWELTLPEATRSRLRQHRQQRRMVDGIRELAWRLQSGAKDRLQVEWFIHPDQSHQSVPMLSLQKACMHHFQR
ncbi:alpha/beta hydrolase [Brenneria sp. 4F2]|nr:alpha/beta hydrolase [Brenneria bubanii]